MEQPENNLANFVIAGADKAGTTSVFVYLSQHPEVCAAIRKETDFFRNEYCGNRQADERQYGSYFRPCLPAQSVVMEASPGYLGDAAIVAPRMRSLTPDIRLLFILRNPVERLYSSFNFHVGRLNIPADIDFEEYVKRCMAYEQGKASPSELGVEEWCLRALSFGRYDDFLRYYFDGFARKQIKVMFFESLRADARTFMQELSGFLDIDPAFWGSYEFRKSNVTFAGRNKLLHRIALGINNAAEPLLRQRPGLKHAIVDFYKAVNGSRTLMKPMAAELREQLSSYYQASNQALSDSLGVDLPDSWLAARTAT